MATKMGYVFAGLACRRAKTGYLGIVALLMAAVVPAGAETLEEERFAAEQKRIFAAVVEPCLADNERAAARIREAIAACNCDSSVKRANLEHLSAAIVKDGAACESRGNEAVLDYIALERARMLERLRSRCSQLNGLRKNYESWANDTLRAQDAAVKEFKGVLSLGAVATLVQGVLKPDALAPLEQKTRHFKYTNNFRLLPELQEFAQDFAQHAQGKTLQEVKALVLATLDVQRKAASDAISVGQEALSEKLTEDTEPSPDVRFATSLDVAYSRIIAVLDISITEGLAPTLKSFDKTTGILGFAPDIARVSLEYFELAVDSNNLEALEKLRTAADGERAAASKWLTVLNDKERTLKARQQELRAARGR